MKLIAILFFILSIFYFEISAAEMDQIVIMDLEEKIGVDEGMGLALADIIREEIKLIGIYQLLTDDDLDSIDPDLVIQSWGCVPPNDLECLVAFGRKCGARYAIDGYLHKVYGLYFIALRMVDLKGVGNKNPRFVYKNWINGKKQLVMSLEGLVEALVGYNPDKEVKSDGIYTMVCNAAGDKTGSERHVKTASGIGTEKLISYRVGDVTFRMVRIDPGVFMMGSPRDEKGRFVFETPHQVTITKSFYLGETEVTQALWQTVMGTNPSRFTACGADCPVEGVTWEEAQRFVCRLGRLTGLPFRLPSEAQWEYACRAGTKSAFSYGTAIKEDQANFGRGKEKDGKVKTVKVASYAPNAWGLYDMHGNVMEWVQDIFNIYPKGPVDDPVGPPGKNRRYRRVRRGGDWYLGWAYLRSASRSYALQYEKEDRLGLRLLHD